MKFMEIDPQPARGKLDESMWDSPDWIAEEKYDGERRIAQFCGRVVRFTGRRSRTTGKVVEKTECLPHLSGLGPKLLPRDRVTTAHTMTTPPAALDGTVLDGELICLRDSAMTEQGRAPRGGESKLVTSIANSLPEEAVRKQIERGWLRYVVFDCLFYQGHDIRHLSLYDRKIRARDAVVRWKNPFVSLADDTGILDPTADKRARLKEIYRDGGEGIILKHKDHQYGNEKGWVKVKKLATADVVIIGFKMAKETSKKVNGEVSRTKYAGKVGSVEIGQYNTADPRKGTVMLPVGFARGFSDRLMEEFTRRPKKYIGKVITIEANDREPTGKFRHPRVVDPENPFRSDKSPQDCIFDLNEK